MEKDDEDVEIEEDEGEGKILNIQVNDEQKRVRIVAEYFIGPKIFLMLVEIDDNDEPLEDRPSAWVVEYKIDFDGNPIIESADDAIVDEVLAEYNKDIEDDELLN